MTAKRTSRGSQNRPAKKRRPKLSAPMPAIPQKAWHQRDGFRFSAGFLGIGFVLLFFSQVFPHDYGFTELGFLFTFSVYDLVLAMIGLGVVCAQATTRQFARIALTFFGVLLVMLSFFPPIFRLIQSTGASGYLFLVAPSALMISGAVLWLPGERRFPFAIVSAVIIAFSLSLFIGLDDFGTSVFQFAMGAVLTALWMVLAPAFLLRQFPGPWIVIAGRIIGSWLIVIGIIELAAMYAPELGAKLPAPQLPTPGQVENPAFQTLQVPLDPSAADDIAPEE
jgi:hypothetical protein